ncbi:MAG: hypothetical protein JO307_29025 [Bryobacterales bacterium]|nr:hypothetical protein [Bryobacterales bacterium]
MNYLLSSTAVAAVLAIALPVGAQTGVPSAVGPATFDGIYAGSLTSAAGPGLSTEGGDNRSKCWTSAPAKMTIRGGYMVMEYPDWKRHTLHYRGTVDPSGAVSLRHTNSDGSIAILTGQIGNGQVTGSMRRGPCFWDLTLAKK